MVIFRFLRYNTKNAMVISLTPLQGFSLLKMGFVTIVYKLPSIYLLNKKG